MPGKYGLSDKNQVVDTYRWKNEEPAAASIQLIELSTGI
jgi:hypothetical protein